MGGNTTISQNVHSKAEKTGRPNRVQVRTAESKNPTISIWNHCEPLVAVDNHLLCFPSMADNGGYSQVLVSNSKLILVILVK